MIIKLKPANKILLIAAASLLSLKTFAQTAHIIVDATKVLNKIPANMYGSCTEDVNHEIYGGLYGQRLFGESFEEPAPALSFIGWTQLPVPWRIGGNGTPSAAGPGFKLVKNTTLIKDGSFEATMKFADKARSAGILIRMNNVYPGNPKPSGYAIEVSKGRNKIVIKKYLNDWQDLATSNNELDIRDSVHVRVNVEGNQIKVYVNGERSPIVEFKDDNQPILSGQAGIYANNAAATFSNCAVMIDGVKTPFPLFPSATSQVSFQWTAVNKNAKAAYQLDSVNAFTGRQSQVIEFLSGTGKAGTANSGLNHWGIAVKAGQKFEGSIYLRTESLSGRVTLALESVNGNKTYSTVQLQPVGKAWKKYLFSFTTTKADSNARFAIYLNKKGKLWIDQATLMSPNITNFKGLPFREDIGTMMQQQGLNFLRYAGTMVNAPQYKWKNMTGPSDKRPPYKGHWYPYTSNGFGIEEFLKFCEAAKFEPAFAINVEDAEQDIANMIEYLTGNAKSAGGKKRAAAGHPQPYKLHYIEIGNEEVIWGDNKNDYQHYTDRFNILANAIHAKNPDIKLVCSAWWRSNSPNMELVFDAVKEKAAYWDLHTDADDANAGTTVDKNLQTMQDLFKKWDPNATMKCTIFEENGGLHNLQRALGHATTLNAVRRHGDFVLTSCPANALQPYLQNDNDWDQGQIFFTPAQVWGMPPFYAQQMAAANHLPLRIDSQTDGSLDVTATCSDDGKTIALHIVNTGKGDIKTDINLKNFDGRKTLIKTITLKGEPNDENSPQEPQKVKSQKDTLTKNGDEIVYTFAANSYTILRFEK